MKLLLETKRKMGYENKSVSDFTPIRRGMIKVIYALLKKKAGSYDSGRVLNEDLLHMAKGLEASLFQISPSLRAYDDKSTLECRLHLLAVYVATKRRECETSRKHENDQRVDDIMNIEKLQLR
uniref:Uncharacterized protein n=1 Tax=Ditylum brightwellii TaxID=49249 RepID=A0A6S9B926_9STRA|mmetsp:Transcript_4794/g.6251  ORF Transcript_4794/g.6251 Transcript_4794/m.6251 type:complete len:123 (-) Transcript_4794:389-757(-)